MRTTRLSTVHVVVAALGASTGRGWVSKISCLGEDAGTYTREHTHPNKMTDPLKTLPSRNFVGWQ